MASREVNHEREIHNALQISQSWEGMCSTVTHLLHVKINFFLDFL